MISREIGVLIATAASIGFIHTVIGPDHYLPFIVIGRARAWSLRKTLLVSALAGVGHILSSVVLGFVGIALGLAVSRLEGFEAFRGRTAGWLLLGFGIAYFLWGVRRAIRNKPHVHSHLHAAAGAAVDHVHADGGGDHTHPHSHGEGPHHHEPAADADAHTHVHVHRGEHVHVHEVPGRTNITPWVLFTIFVFGPCEPLIPLLMYPAAKHSTAGVALVAGAFGIVTIGTMLAIIALASLGLSFVRLGRLERYAHALAGLMIALSGLAVQFLGL